MTPPTSDSDPATGAAPAAGARAPRVGRWRWRRTLAAPALLVAFGVVRLPVESALEGALRDAGLHRGALDLSVHEQLGQAGFLAVLGGFRSLVASILNLEAYTAWENVEWGKVEGHYRLITRLQPQIDHYWDTAHWHLAYNAASYYQRRSDLSEPLRRQLFRDYVEKGRQLLEEGIRNVPDGYRLPAQMAELHRKRVDPPDPCEAARYYRMAAEAPNAPEYFRRFHAYALADCPGREREAHALLRALYLEGPRHHKPTLLTRLAALEERLGIPPGERLVEPLPPSGEESGPAAPDGGADSGR